MVLDEHDRLKVYSGGMEIDADLQPEPSHLLT
jgi:hypothetical protein